MALGRWRTGSRDRHSADDSVYQLTNHSGLDWEIQTLSQDWVHLNRGDGSIGFVRTPIVRF